MAIKTTGAEFWRFYEDEKAWPEGAWHEDTVVKVDSEVVDDYTSELLPDTAQVVIDGGVIYMDEYGDKSAAFESHFRKWRKAQSMAGRQLARFRVRHGHRLSTHRARREDCIEPLFSVRVAAYFVPGHDSSPKVSPHSRRLEEERYGKRSLPS